jgi:thiol-disulfide isomerase/thioredoxin
MKNLLTALLYTGLMITANLGSADSIADLRDGDLRRLVFHDTARPFEDAVVEGPSGLVSLSDYRGKVVVLNFWAIWCAPCREEMPTLEALATHFSDADLAVVTLASGPNAPPAIDKFFDETGVTRLPKFRDPRSTVARSAGVFGLPVTVVLNQQGQEVARLTGTADWSSDSAYAIVEALLDRDVAE